MTTTVTTKSLIDDAMTSLANHPVGDQLDPNPVVLNLPAPDRHGETAVHWHPLVALAVAGHIAQHWSIVHAQEAPFEIESGRWMGNAAILRWGNARLRPSRRLEAGSEYSSGEGIWVRELCGHAGCPNDAPAGSGSRCFDHFVDPAPGHHATTYWAELAAEAWNQQHPSAGEEKALLDNRRNGLIMGAIAAGMTKMELHELTGIARTTIDRILAPPQPPAEDPNDPLGLYGPA